MKVVFKNSILISLLSTFVILACDRRSEEERWEAAIRTFIYEHQEEFSAYQPITFKKIDEAFLNKQELIERSLKVLQDTTKKRIVVLKNSNRWEETAQLQAFTAGLSISQVDELLKVQARVARYLKPEHLEELSVQESESIALLDQVLSSFNLSIYGLDFDTKSVIYYHQFLMDGEEYSGIFEVDRSTLKVTSFRIDS